MANTLDILNDPKIPKKAAHISEQLKKMKAEQNPDVFLDYAKKLIFPEPKKGPSKLKESVKELARGMKRHWDPRLIYAKFKAALRAGHTANELRAEFKKTTEEPAQLSDSYEMQLIAGKIVLADIQEHMAKKGDPEFRRQLSKLIERKEAQAAFRRAKQLAKTGEAKAICTSYLAYAIAIQSEEKPAAEEVLKNTEKEVGLAATTLENERKKWKGKRELEALDIYDALVANYLAQGHLAIQLNRDYVHPMGAVPLFTRAVQQAAELPYSSQQWEATLGSPLLTSIARRKEYSALKYASKERNLRNAMAYFVEGAFALHWKQFDTAAAQMEAGVKMLDREDKEFSEMDYTSMTYQEEYRKKSSVLKDDLIAMKAISGVESGKGDESLIGLMRWVLPNKTPKGEAKDAVEQLTPELLKEAMQKAATPLVKYAFGVALEERTASIGKALLTKSAIADVEAKLKDYRAIRNQSMRGLTVLDEILADEALMNQYGPVKGLANAALARMTSGDHFLKKATLLREDNHLTEAAALVQSGLSRQIENTALWKMLLSVRTDILSLTPVPSKNEVADTERMIQFMEKLAPAAKYTRQFWLGELFARIGEYEDAIDAFHQASKMATTATQRTKAIARGLDLKYRTLP